MNVLEYISTTYNLNPDSHYVQLCMMYVGVKPRLRLDYIDPRVAKDIQDRIKAFIGYNSNDLFSHSPGRVNKENSL